MKVLITGAAGFIGSALAKSLLARGDTVVGIDNFNDYYEVSLKYARLDTIQSKNFIFEKGDIVDRDFIPDLFKRYQFDAVMNLAAQAGVRYSIENPNAYIDANLVGFGNILEACRHNQVKHLVYASSSSVYGQNEKMPFSEADSVDHPVSIYAATKKANEILAHSYSHLFNLPCTGLRFFTVYGPWSRPDMAMIKFAHKIVKGEPIDVYNNGNLKRDFTYIDDIVDGIVRVIDNPAKASAKWDGNKPNPGISYAPFRIYNIGNNTPEPLMRYIKILETNLGTPAKLNMMPMQPGDVPATYADIDNLSHDLGYKPKIGIDEGIKEFVNWYKSYYST